MQKVHEPEPLEERRTSAKVELHSMWNKAGGQAMKYTPGNWHLEDPRQIAKSGGGVIATAWWFGNKGTVSKKEAEANAKLIVNAPEMYEIINTLENDNGSIPDWLWDKVVAVRKKVGG